MPERLQKIIITDEEHHLPYSKGLTATSLMATGLPPDQAYNIAAMVHEALRDEGVPEVTMDHVRRTAERILAEEAGPEYVEVYRKWQSLGKLNRPIILLMGGATGVGKSTVATMLAARLGIIRQVSTDVIREVMRSLFAHDLMPALYNSSFTAFEALRIPLPQTTDKVILGFLEQAAMVWVGIRALIERAVIERTNFIVEGAHAVPGIIDPQFFKDAFVVQMMLSVEDAAEHRSHFEIREVETEGARPFSRYVRNLDSIRKIQDYVLDLARKEKVPIFPCHNIDQTVGAILEYVIGEVFGGDSDRSAETDEMRASRAGTLGITGRGGTR
jgi:2-phosphoglycerate kinase